MPKQCIGVGNRSSAKSLIGLGVSFSKRPQSLFRNTSVSHYEYFLFTHPGRFVVIVVVDSRGQGIRSCYQEQQKQFDDEQSFHIADLIRNSQNNLKVFGWDISIY